MKKLTIFLIAVPFILGSCLRDPYADFFVSSNVVETGDIVYFTNNSIDADHFEWDFGDGYREYTFDANHSYQNEGTYTVTLFAFAGNRMVDKAVTTITILFPTTLDVIVLEYWDEYEVADASVRLYGTYDDWVDEVYMVDEAFTNQFGWTSFSHLQEQRYYIDVWEANHDNYTLAKEDIYWIETHVLVPNEINEFIAYVDYYPDEKKSSAIPDRTRRIVKLEHTGSRKYVDKVPSIEQRLQEHKQLRAKQMELAGEGKNK